MSIERTPAETAPEPTADDEQAAPRYEGWLMLSAKLVDPPPDRPAPDGWDEGPPPTEEDGDAVFASFVWYEDASARVELNDYVGTYVAVLGEEVIDAHPDVYELCRRLFARGDTITRNRVLIRQRGTPENPVWW